MSRAMEGAIIIMTTNLVTHIAPATAAATLKKQIAINLTTVVGTTAMPICMAMHLTTAVHLHSSNIAIVRIVNWETTISQNPGTGMVAIPVTMVTPTRAE